MGNFVKVADAASISEGAAVAVQVQDKSIAIFKMGGKLYAIDNLCRHRGGPLAEGSTDGNVVTCPWHGWQFDITNGACLTNPAAATTKYETKVEGGDVLVDI